jgi:hypothetical protein
MTTSPGLAAWTAVAARTSDKATKRTHVERRIRTAENLLPDRTPAG